MTCHQFLQLYKGKYHCKADLFYLCGFRWFVYVELATELLGWLNPNESNKRTALQWYFHLRSKRVLSAFYLKLEEYVLSLCLCWRLRDLSANSMELWNRFSFNGLTRPSEPIRLMNLFSPLKSASTWKKSRFYFLWSTHRHLREVDRSLTRPACLCWR